MFKFITSRPLWVNILAGVALMFIILFLFLFSLDLITRHGETLTIPSVTGKSFDQARNLLEGQGFDVEIQDSVYVDTAKPAMVVRQFPDAESEVKQNRTVYLTINRTIPPSVEMPNLVNMSFRGAEIALKQYGLKLEDTTYRLDYAKNSVLEQQYNGQVIKPGTRITMGSGITLVLGSGLGNREFSMPNLVGRSFTEAKILLESMGLTLGVVTPGDGVTDNNMAFVSRQNPAVKIGEQTVQVRPGQLVDLWLSAEPPTPDPDSYDNGADY